MSEDILAGDPGVEGKSYRVGLPEGKIGGRNPNPDNPENREVKNPVPGSKEAGGEGSSEGSDGQEATAPTNSEGKSQTEQLAEQGEKAAKGD